MPWTALSFQTTHEAIDWVSTLLAQTACDIRMADLPQPSAWAMNLCLYCADRDQVEPILDRLLPMYRTGLITEPQVMLVNEKPDEVGSTHRVGQHFIVTTPAEDAEDIEQSQANVAKTEQDTIALILKKSFTFGSGLHPTTIVGLRLLERHVMTAMNALDLGSGSGILSVAMAKLGATVLALDNDPIAVAATQDAIERNNVQHQVTAQRGSLGSGSELGHWMGGEMLTDVPMIKPSANFDLVMANLPGHIQISLASDFQQALRHAPHTLLITSGFTTDYEPEVDRALTASGFVQVDCERSDEWVALVHRLK